MGMHKNVKPQFGGGMRRFSCEEDNIYENIESELCFFTSQVRCQTLGHVMYGCQYCLNILNSINCKFNGLKCMFSFFFLLCVRGFVQERQSIIKYWLDNLRAKQGEVLHNIHFLEGQPISMLRFFYEHFI